MGGRFLSFCAVYAKIEESEKFLGLETTPYTKENRVNDVVI